VIHAGHFRRQNEFVFILDEIHGRADSIFLRGISIRNGSGFLSFQFRLSGHG
jgi:hypothetical protein